MFFPHALPSSTDVPVLSLVSRVDGIPDGRSIHVKNIYKCGFINIQICMDGAFHDSVNLKIRPESFHFFQFIYN